MQATRPRMTATEAKSFARYSVANAVFAEAGLRHAGICVNGCKAYQDIYTYERWQALGYQVQRGQHGTKIAVIVHTQPKEGEDEGLRLLRNSTVFCRCQVKEIER